jgi:hypothetical protein
VSAQEAVVPERVQEALGGLLCGERSASKSAVSREFVSRTREHLAAREPRSPASHTPSPPSRRAA